MSANPPSGRCVRGIAGVALVVACWLVVEVSLLPVVAYRPLDSMVDRLSGHAVGSHVARTPVTLLLHGLAAACAGAVVGRLCSAGHRLLPWSWLGVPIGTVVLVLLSAVLAGRLTAEAVHGPTVGAAVLAAFTRGLGASAGAAVAAWRSHRRPSCPNPLQ